MLPPWSCPRCGPGAASATAHGVDVCSITQSRKLERNPCGTAGYRAAGAGQ